MRATSFLFFPFLLSLGIPATRSNEAEAGNALLLDFYRTGNDPCNICGADDGVLGKGEVVLPPGFAGILQEERTCAEVQELALDGYFRPASCLLMPYALFELCGCISSQPPRVFPPEEQQDPEPTSPPIPAPETMTTSSTTVFILLGGLTSPLDSENVDVFEQVCADFLVAELGNEGVDDGLMCTIENQIVVVDPAGASSDGESMTSSGVQLELEITAETPPSVDLGDSVQDVLEDGLQRLIEALQDASDAFDGISGWSLFSTSVPTPAPTIVVVEVDPDDGDDDIFGLKRNLFIAIAAGSGAFLLMMLVLLCTCGRGTAGGPIGRSKIRAGRPEQAI